MRSTRPSACLWSMGSKPGPSYFIEHPAPPSARTRGRKMPPVRHLTLATLLALNLTAVVSAETPPAGPPPPSSGRATSLPTPDLLPGIGKLGAQVSIFGGGSWNPYEN